MNREQSTAQRAADALHEGVSQHIIGMLLAARALTQDLKRANSSQAGQAADLVELIQQADIEIRKIIRLLDEDLPR